MASYFPDTDSEDELPLGWEERVDPDGRVFFVDHTNKTTQWLHPKDGKARRVPDELPFGWGKIVNDKGEIIFEDHINNKKTLTDPRLAFSYEDKPNGTVRQRYDSSTTANVILNGRDLTGKVAIVTGASSGLGLEIARSLSFHGSTVIIACRNLEKTNNVIYKLRGQRVINFSCNFS